jgi:hypothetical protein
MGAPPATPALSLHSTALCDLHVDAWHAVPPVMSMLDAWPRPTRAAPLWAWPPKLKPATVALVDPDDGPLVKPPTLLATAAS